MLLYSAAFHVNYCCAVKENKNIWERLFILQWLTKSMQVVIKKCRQLTMGGAIADSVTHSQMFDADFRSLEIELGTSHRKTHTLPNHSSNEKNTLVSPLSVHPECSSPLAHMAKQRAWDFYMCSEAFFFSQLFLWSGFHYNKIAVEMCIGICLVCQRNLFIKVVWLLML